MCKFGIAINRTWKDREGQPQQETTYVDCEAWGRTGEIICQYLTKGKPIFVSGRLKLDQWQDQGGQNRSKLKVVVEKFQFVGSRAEHNISAGGGQMNQSTAINVGDDDIPF